MVVDCLSVGLSFWFFNTAIYEKMYSAPLITLSSVLNCVKTDKNKFTKAV